MEMKDKNEFTKATAETAAEKRTYRNGKIEVNTLSFDVSLGLKPVLEKKLDNLLSSIYAVKEVIIAGMLCDCDKNVEFIVSKLKEHRIEVGNIDIQVQM